MVAGQAPGKVIDPFEFRRAVVRGIQSTQTDGHDLATGRRVRDAKAVKTRHGARGEADQQLEFAALVAPDEEGFLHWPRTESMVLVERLEECTHMGCRHLRNLEMRLRHRHPAGDALDAVDDEQCESARR